MKEKIPLEILKLFTYSNNPELANFEIEQTDKILLLKPKDSNFKTFFFHIVDKQQTQVANQNKYTVKIKPKNRSTAEAAGFL